MIIALALLSAVGLTFALKYGRILDFIRNPLCRISILKELFSCSLCLGFWSGCLIAGFLYYLDRQLYYILFPFAASGVAWLIDSFIRTIQTIEIYLDKKLEK